MNLSIKEIIKKELTIHELVCGNETDRYATIFSHNNQFVKCNFHTLNRNYDLDDWIFLGQLSRIINTTFGDK